MEEKINEFLELRTNYLNNLKVESANTFFSNKYMFLFGIILKKEYHKYENCYQLELKNFDECENLINLLEIKESERLMNKFKIYESKEKFPYYARLCFRKQDSLNGYII